MIWGGVPVDTIWVRECKLFQEGMKRYENGEFNEIEGYVGVVRALAVVIPSDTNVS